MADRQEVLDWLAGIAAGSIDLAADNQVLASAAIGLIDLDIAASELPPGHLTENFSMNEMIYSDTANSMCIENEPNAKQTENLERLCGVLEQIRALCGGNPVIVSSGYRCPEVNAAVGGVNNSAHLYGLAADITIPDFGTPAEICEMVRPYLADWGIDQLINETGWVHVGLCEPPAQPRCECFVI